jgi:hypothetical protein
MMVVVHSHLPTRVALRQRGMTVVLAPGRNEVDAAFWRAWSERHAGTALDTAFTTEGAFPLPAASAGWRGYLIALGANRASTARRLLNLPGTGAAGRQRAGRC